MLVGAMVGLTVFLTALASVAPSPVAHFVVGILRKAEVVRALEATENFVWDVIQITAPTETFD